VALRLRLRSREARDDEGAHDGADVIVRVRAPAAGAGAMNQSLSILDQKSIRLIGLEIHALPLSEAPELQHRLRELAVSLVESTATVTFRGRQSMEVELRVLDTIDALAALVELARAFRSLQMEALESGSFNTIRDELASLRRRMTGVVT
jgi:hypothetical protein